MNYYIGIDIGTTSVKSVAFSEDGRIVGSANIGYPIRHAHPGWSEQDPDEIFEAVAESLGKLSLSFIHHTPLLISFSAAMHSLMAVDEKGHPLTPLIIWADNRAAAIAEKLRNTDQGKFFYQQTGVPVHPMSPLCKLLWLKEHDPALLQNAHQFIGIKEYVIFRLFGKYIVDEPVASATGLLNLHTLQWDEAIVSFVGIRLSQLPGVVEPTHTEYLASGSAHLKDARLLPFAATAFVAGGSDGALANLGSNAVTPDTMTITVGTSGAVRIVTNEVAMDPGARTFCYYFGNGKYITGGASNNGGVVLQWLKDTLLKTTDSYETLLKEAEKIPAGCDRLLGIPYILGERAPVWNALAKGVLFGLDITHSRAHIVRSMLEAIVFALFSIGKILMEEHNVTEIFVTGGFTLNPFWLQILSDMFNLPVRVSGAAEGSAMGAVLVGLQAIGIQNKWKPKISDQYQPHPQTHAIYLRKFEQFERVYAALVNEMHANA